MSLRQRQEIQEVLRHMNACGPFVSRIPANARLG